MFPQDQPMGSPSPPVMPGQQMSPMGAQPMQAGPNALMSLAMPASASSLPDPFADLGLMQVGPEVSPIARAMMAFAETMGPLMMQSAPQPAANDITAMPM